MIRIERVLVIKLSALGDMVLALAAIERIRLAHPTATITLLTTAPYAALGRACPWIDVVHSDGRPATLRALFALIRSLRRARYQRVYDLQTNDRTNLYFQALRPFAPTWSGTAFGCALPHRNRARMGMHSLERQAEQLKDAGIWPDAPTRPGQAPGPDITWLIDPATAPALGDKPLALLVPGASARRPAKRWPAARFGDLARALLARGYDVALIGAAAERNLAAEIGQAAPGARDLTGATDFAQLATLGARAALAVGNDTGPLHLIAAAGAPAVALFSGQSDPDLCAPRGKVTILRRQDLQSLPIDVVLTAALAIRGTSDELKS